MKTYLETIRSVLIERAKEGKKCPVLEGIEEIDDLSDEDLLKMAKECGVL